MALSILLLVALIILADLILITVLFLKAGKTVEKVEMLCDTFERTIHNALEDSTSRIEGLDKKLAEVEDHLRTINKNIYIMARQIIRHEEEQEAG